MEAMRLHKIRKVQKQMTKKARVLETIDVVFFNFTEIGLFLGCVGSKSQIQQMRAYEYFRKEQKRKTALTDFLKRALSHGLYCFLQGETLYGKLLAWILNSKISKTGQKIEESLWMEAVFFVSPKAISDKLGISLEEMQKLRKGSIWCNLYDCGEQLTE